MNLALGAVIIALLISPGFIFRSSFLKSDALKSAVDTTVLSEALFILIPVGVFHIIGVLFVELVLRYAIKFDQLYYAILGVTDKNLINFQILQDSFARFIFYTLLVNALAAILGRVLQKVVEQNDLDQQFRFLKVSNEWELLFSGRFLPKSQRSVIEFIQLDAVISMEEGEFLYCGVLEKFTLDSKQGVKELVLSSVYRRKFSMDLNKAEEDKANNTENSTDDKTPNHHQEQQPAIWEKRFDSRYYNMPGDFFVIPFSQVKNLNVTYYTFIEE